MHTLLEPIDRVYSAAAECATAGIVTHRIANASFHRFSSAITAFEAHLKATQTLENWLPQIGYLKIFRLKYATSIVSASELFKTTRLRGSPLALGALMAGADSDTMALFRAVDEAFKRLQTEAVNPLLRHFTDLLAVHEDGFDETVLKRRKTTAILCEWSDLFDSTDSVIRGIGEGRKRRFCVVKPSQLKELTTFDELVVFGSWRWFERKGHSFIFRAPRCRSLVNFCFDTIPDYQPQFYQLAGSPHRFQRASHSRPRLSHPGFSTVVAEPSQRQSFNDEVTVSTILDEMIPVIDLDKVSRRTGGMGGGGQADSVEAKLVELSGNSGVWLSEDGMVYKMELEHSPGGITCKRVRHVNVSDIAPGAALIFSTAGGGDMIVEEANSLMGAAADSMRAIQMVWKQKLAEKVRIEGAEQVFRTLKALGVTCASLVNLRNWMSPANIAPADRNHFVTILEACGLASEVERITVATDRIRRAHRAAGFMLSRELFRMIQGKPLTELAAVGFQVFGGNEAIASEKTAFTVESISAGTKCVDSGVINKPFTLDEDLWR